MLLVTTYWDDPPSVAVDGASHDPPSSTKDWNFAPKFAVGNVSMCFSTYMCILFTIHTIPTVEPNGQPLFFGWFQPKTLQLQQNPHLVASGNTSFSSLTAKLNHGVGN